MLKKVLKLKLIKLDFGEPNEHSTVEGLIASVSPMRSGNKYFEGEITDGRKCIRIVGFDGTQHNKLASFVDDKKPSNCEVKKSLSKDDCEVVVKSYTGLQLSPTHYDISNIENVGTTNASLSDLSKMNRYDWVNVTVKVMKLNDLEVVGNGKHIISDSTGSCLLTIWEDDIGKIEEGNSYQLSRLFIQCFKGNTYLSYSSMTTAAIIGDLPDIVDVEPTSSIVLCLMLRWHQLLICQSIIYT